MAGTSLVVRSMGIGLQMQGTWVRSWSRMILHAGATKPRYCNYWAQSPNDWRLCTYSWCSPWQCECHGPQLQRARGQQRRSSTTKNKIKKKKKRIITGNIEGWVQANILLLSYSILGMAQYYSENQIKTLYSLLYVIYIKIRSLKTLLETTILTGHWERKPDLVHRTGGNFFP